MKAFIILEAMKVFIILEAIIIILFKIKSIIMLGFVEFLDLEDLCKDNFFSINAIKLSILSRLLKSLSYSNIIISIKSQNNYNNVWNIEKKKITFVKLVISLSFTPLSV